jgi:[histone H3]-lysine27 N-trimethyltransferase EZH2
MHPANEACDEKCHCWERGFCEKFCVCNPDLCKKNYFFCNCTSECRTFQCPCFNAGRECDPDKCKKCTDENPLNKCVNKSCRLKKYSKTAIARSIIAGWGLFALENIKKDDLIQEYTGEIIDTHQLEERDMWNNVEEITYIFDLNDQVKIDLIFLNFSTA